jgi:hypothetical protein
VSQGPGRPWVWDEVQDETTGANAIVTDVLWDGRYVLRPVYGSAEWIAEDPKKLTVICRREHRSKCCAVIMPNDGASKADSRSSAVNLRHREEDR